MNMKLISILILSVFTYVLAKETPTEAPVWPNQFEQSFEETFIYPLVGSHTTKGKFYYDWNNKQYRVDRENGHYDRYCGPVYPLSNTACSQIVVNGDRFIYYPEKDYCCYCCSNEHGCGVLKPDWLAGAKFEGITNENGVDYERWNKPGLQSNIYLATVDDRVMRRIDQQPNDVQNFNVSSFTPRITDPSVFTLPSKCQKNFACPTLSTCTAVRASTQNLAFLQ